MYLIPFLVSLLSFTDVHALLLTDVLAFLQEKEQKFVFATLVQKYIHYIVFYFCPWASVCALKKSEYEFSSK